MIVADFSRSGKGIRLRIEGHADFDEHGKDIVCAATSSVFYALCAYLLNFKRGFFKVLELKNGLAVLDCDTTCEEQLQMACLGLWQLSRDYPENICVNIGAWNWRMNPPIEVKI